MKLLLDLVNHPLTHRVGWALLHSLWQGAFVAVLFGLLRFALRRASAQARYFAACFSLLLLAIAPVMTVLLIGNDFKAGRGNGFTFDGAGQAAVVAEHSPAMQAGNKASLFIFQSVEVL